MVKPKRKRLVYWGCQLLGWGGMILYEVINFMGMGYEWNGVMAQQFALFGIAGILLTHGYRKVLDAIGYWQRNTAVQLVLFGMFVFVISALLYVFASVVNHLYNPQKALALFTGRTLMYIINWSRYVLVWMLCYHAYKLFEKNMTKEVEKKEAILQKQLLEMEVLRSQINPHFLFNTLNCIRSLIVSSPQKAREAATLLSEVLRYTLNYEKSNTVPLSEELTMTDKYLQLEKLRFEDRLHYRIEAPNGVDNITVPPVLLLTLAENAIKHGIGKLVEGGVLHIRVEKNKTDAHIVVENSGYFIYFTKEGLGKGLLNTQKRLEFVYPGCGRFTIKNGDNGKVNATIIIPL
jgi:two-component system, LytTR family, sensor kinase